MDVFRYNTSSNTHIDTSHNQSDRITKTGVGDEMERNEGKEKVLSREYYIVSYIDNSPQSARMLMHGRHTKIPSCRSM